MYNKNLHNIYILDSTINQHNPQPTIRGLNQRPNRITLSLSFSVITKSNHD